MGLTWLMTTRAGSSLALTTFPTWAMRRAAGAAVGRRADGAVFQIEPGPLHRRPVGLDGGVERFGGGPELFGLLLGGHALLQQLGVAAGLGGGGFRLGGGAGGGGRRPGAGGGGGAGSGPVVPRERPPPANSAAVATTVNAALAGPGAVPRRARAPTGKLIG